MGRYQETKTSFSTGIMSEKAIMQVTAEAYPNAILEGENIYLDNLGGFIKREGSVPIPVDATENNTKKSFLVSYNYSNTSYLVKVHNNRLFIYKKDGSLTANLDDAIVADLFETDGTIKKFRITQVKNWLVFTHRTFAPFYIALDGSTWSIARLNFSSTPLYRFGNSTLAGTGTLTISDLNSAVVTAVSSTNIFTAAHVNQVIASPLGGAMRITDFISTAQVKGVVIVAFSSVSGNTVTIPAGKWEIELDYEEVWSATRGYPKACSSYQGRLWFASTEDLPNYFWGSVVDQFENFNQGIARASDAIQAGISGGESNDIEHLVSARRLFILTDYNEYVVPQQDGTPITPANVSVIQISNHGSSQTLPITAKSSVLFIEKSGRILREISPDQNVNRFISKSVSQLVPHLILNPSKISLRIVSGVITNETIFLCNTTIPNPDCEPNCTPAINQVPVLNSIESIESAAYTLFNFKRHANLDVSDVEVIDGVVFINFFNGTNYIFAKLQDNTFVDLQNEATSATDVSKFTTTFNDQTFSVKSLDGDTMKGEVYLGEKTTDATGELDISPYLSKKIIYGHVIECRVTNMPNIAIEGTSGKKKKMILINIRSVRCSYSYDLEITQFPPSTLSIPATTKKKVYKVHIFKAEPRTMGSFALNNAPQLVGWKTTYVSGVVCEEPICTIVQKEPYEFHIASMIIKYRI